ncbi:sensor histidine kinase [Eubacterium xylanophilum]|uniref:sensor histidine kinase n=1 Tax=Eubacterium xylanophilum TaxID=39497 RepID=UPI0004B83359|nr:histidine kinase [Eubacterium xylanophilum]
MNKLLDKIMINLLTVVAMYNFMHGISLIIFIYLSITYSAISYYLITRNALVKGFRPQGMTEWILYIIDIIIMIVFMIKPEFALFMPIIFYDMIHSKNIPAFVLGVFAYVNMWIQVGKSSSEITVQAMILSISLCVVAGYLTIKSEKHSLLTYEYKKLLDRGKVDTELLAKQNAEILRSKDMEISNAQTEERNRIARDIHDNVGHMLSRAILQVGALLSIYKDDPLKSQLSTLRETLDLAMNNIRSSVHDIHDESIDVKKQIMKICDGLSEHFSCEINIDIDDNMPRDVKYAVIGITKEAVSNIIKHSSNRLVSISLIRHPSIYQLIIHDYSDSKFQPVKDALIANRGGMGLENMRNRVESVDGIINITKDSGYRIFVSIPVEEK